MKMIGQKSGWREIHTEYASGRGLRELAQRTGILAGRYWRGESARDEAKDQRQEKGWQVAAGHTGGGGTQAKLACFGKRGVGSGKQVGYQRLIFRVARGHGVLRCRDGRVIDGGESARELPSP